VVTSDAALAETLRQNTSRCLKDVVKKPEIDVSTDTFGSPDATKLVARCRQGISADFFGIKDALAQEKVTYNARSASDFVESRSMKFPAEGRDAWKASAAMDSPAERSRPF